jgi:hypothetical protein
MNRFFLISVFTLFVFTIISNCYVINSQCLDITGDCEKNKEKYLNERAGVSVSVSSNGQNYASAG